MSQRLWDTRSTILKNFTDNCSSSSNKSDRKISKATIEHDYGFLSFCRQFHVLIHWCNFGSDPSSALIFSIHFIFNNFDRYQCAYYLMKRLKITVKKWGQTKKITCVLHHICRQSDFFLCWFTWSLVQIYIK